MHPLTRRFALVAALLSLTPAMAGLKTLTVRPPNLESPITYFNEMFTPNDRFFVRYHLSAIPKVDPVTWRLTILGGKKPVSFTLAELRTAFKWVEVPAVAVCAGNRRALFEPRVPGVQWGPGAMGNAVWRGVRLKDLLERAGLKDDAVELAFDGADGPALPSTPDFVKSLPLEKALDENTLVALEMNGKPLPQLQGFPARLVVPGWAATYWVKHLVSITVLDHAFDGFWMKTAYRLPKGKFPAVEGAFPSQADEKSVPITELIVNSMVTNTAEGTRVKQGARLPLKGVAWDGGHGIERVELSEDGGAHWSPAALGKDYGPYSWRQFSFSYEGKKPGPAALLVRATNLAGQTQGSAAIHNPAGYHNNALQTLHVVVE